MNLSFVMHLLEDGNMNSRNMQETYGVHNILSYTYVQLLVLISYRNFQKLDAKVSAGSGKRQVADCCEYGNEHPRSIKCREQFEQLMTSQLLKQGSLCPIEIVSCLLGPLDSYDEGTIILRNVENYSPNETSDIAHQCVTTHYNSTAFSKCSHGNDICVVLELNLECYNAPCSHCNVTLSLLSQFR